MTMQARRFSPLLLAALLLVVAPVVSRGQAKKGKPPETPVAGAPWTTPGVNLALLPIAPGAFEMGDAAGLKREKPPHQVKLTRPFWMAKYEVTNAQFKQFTAAASYQGAEAADADYLRQLSSRGGVQAGNDHPVIYVSWHNAVAFCKWLTGAEREAGRLPEGYVYRLPTEAEWEYCSRAGAEPAEPDTVAWHDGNSSGHTRKVGALAANAWGLHDMLGNVFEWCADWRGPYAAAALTDPTGPASGRGRIRRGGGWYSALRHCRVAYRHDYAPGRTNYDLGFRVVLAPALAK